MYLKAEIENARMRALADRLDAYEEAQARADAASAALEGWPDRLYRADSKRPENAVQDGKPTRPGRVKAKARIRSAVDALYGRF